MPRLDGKVRIRLRRMLDADWGFPVVPDLGNHPQPLALKKNLDNLGLGTYVYFR